MPDKRDRKASRVLVADDDPAILRLVTTLVEKEGYSVVTARDGREAVNVTLGLPFIRTSVDHGTAFDIAGRGVAEHSSMVAAIALAATLARTEDAGRAVEV